MKFRKRTRCAMEICTCFFKRKSFFYLYLVFIIFTLMIVISCVPSDDRRTRASGLEMPSHQTAPTLDRLYEQSWAVLIGINNYENKNPKPGTAIPALTHAVEDVNKIKETLIEVGFPEDNIATLTNSQATKQAIEQKFEDFLAPYIQLQHKQTGKVKPNDRVVIFFAGHGERQSLPRGGERGFFLPYDADINKLATTAISFSDSTLRDIGERTGAFHVLFVLDTCYSGFPIARSLSQMTPEALRIAAGQRAIQVVSAGRSGEKAKDGLFTQIFVENIKKSLRTSGATPLHQLHGMVTTEVMQWTGGNQNPQIGNLIPGQPGDSPSCVG